MISAACETYHPFFLIPDLQRRNNCEARWRQLLGDHVICMESPEDTCAVAAVIVGLTEGVLPNVGAAANVLTGAGVAPERIAATIRAVQGYADQNDPDAVKRLHTGAATSAAAKPAWWKKLFS